ncbi:hypothetical protein J6590_070233 [Homalodisca vitripennis]|nr:hypothetical protein J6590_070233 [Homalodisca vitripennis]
MHRSITPSLTLINTTLALKVETETPKNTQAANLSQKSSDAAHNLRAVLEVINKLVEYKNNQQSTSKIKWLDPLNVIEWSLNIRIYQSDTHPDEKSLSS